MDQYLQNNFETFDLSEDFLQISNQSIHDILEELSEIPHLAGDFRDIYLADSIKQKFIDYGLDYAEVRNYQNLIKYRISSNRNRDLFYIK